MLSGAVSGELTHVTICNANQAVIGGTINGGDYAIAMTGGSLTPTAMLHGSGQTWSTLNDGSGLSQSFVMSATGGNLMTDLSASGGASVVHASGGWTC